MTNSKFSGIRYAFLAALISGVSIFVNKFAVSAISPALLFTSTKNLMVGLLILSFLLFTKKYKQIKNLTRKEFFMLLAIGFIGGTVPFYLFFTGLSMVPAVTGAIIQKTLVVWVTLLALFFLKERISKKQSLGIFALFASNLLIGGFGGFKFSTGELYILVATLLWAVETVIAKKVLTNVDPDIVTGFRMGLGSLVLMAATFLTVPEAFRNGLTLTSPQIFWLGLTILTLFFYVSTWYRALKKAGAIEVTAILVVSTLITNALSAIFVTHTWNAILTLQIVVMISGMIFYIRSVKNLKIAKDLN